MKWKRMLGLTLLLTLICAALCGAASASRHDDAARDLAGIGMFRGTASGFELDRAPTRSEAAIMLVRLYGAEESAKADYAAGKLRHPFTDVSAFTSPYVAWLYTNGITKGTGATTFSAQNACSLQNYVVFLLRALGYRDGVDFQYKDALTFARGISLDTSSVSGGTFLRDDLAELTWNALTLDLKDGSTWLLDSLIQRGAIDATAAAPLRTKMEAARSASAFPVPTGAMFGLTGEDATLYDAAVRYLREEYADFLREGDDLMIPALTVYGKYDGDNGETRWVCHLRRLFFYGLDLKANGNANALGSEQVGSAGNLALISVSKEGVCTGIDDAPDGDTPAGRLRWLQKICGPLTGLAKDLDSETAVGRELTPHAWEDIYNTYLKTFFPQSYREA